MRDGGRGHRPRLALGKLASVFFPLPPSPLPNPKSTVTSMGLINKINENNALFSSEGLRSSGYKRHFPPNGADVNSSWFCPNKGLLAPGCEAKHLSLYSWPSFNLRTRGQPGEQNKVVKQNRLRSGEFLNLSSPLNRELLKRIMEGCSFQFELFSLFNSQLLCLRLLPFKPTAESFGCRQSSWETHTQAAELSDFSFLPVKYKVP